MSGQVLYEEEGFVISDSTINYLDVAYPVSTVTEFSITAAPLAVNAGNARVNIGYISMLSGFIVAIGSSESVTMIILGLAMMGGGLYLVREGYKARKEAKTEMKAARDVNIALSTGTGIIVRVATQEYAEEVVDALKRALSPAYSTVSVSDELSKLSALKAASIISEDEWTRAKELFLGKAPDAREESISQLKKLHALAEDGVLSESEFNMKKRDILSR